LQPICSTTPLCQPSIPLLERSGLNRTSDTAVLALAPLCVPSWLGSSFAVPSWLGLWLQCLTSSRGKKTNKPRARADRSTSSAMVHHVNLFHRPAFLLLSCVFFGTACFCPEVWLPPERLALFITGPSANEDLVCLLCFSLSFSFSHLHTHLFLFTYILLQRSHPSFNHISTNIFTYN
jgi:hypothetical protein